MSDDRFLSRWSRMKSRSRAGGPGRLAERTKEPAPANAWRRPDGDETRDGTRPAARPAKAAPVGADEAADFAEDAAPEDEEAVLAQWPEDLPQPDELDAESDYSAFFSPEVSEAVRNLALRRLWRSNPLLANLDGLVDYGEDFTDAATVVANMKSAYQVGRGYARDEPVAAEADEADEADAADEDVAAAEEASPEGGPDAPDETAEGTTGESGTDEKSADAASDAAADVAEADPSEDERAG